MNILKVKEQSGGNSLQVTFNNNSVVSCPKVNSNIEYELVKEWLAIGGVIEDEFTTEELEAQATIISKQKISLDKQNGKVYTSLDNIDYIVPLTSEDANGLIQVQIGFEKGYISSTNFICSNSVTIPLDSVTNLLHLGEWFVKERNKFFTLEV